MSPVAGGDPGRRGRRAHARPTWTGSARSLGTAYGMHGPDQGRGPRRRSSSWARELLRRPPAAAARPDVSRRALRRFVEVELGLGLTVLFAAASLTSLPPARGRRRRPRHARRGGAALHAAVARAHVADDRGHAGRRPQRARARTPTGRGRSSTTTWPGLFVLAMGLLALAARDGPGALGAALAARLPRPGRLSARPQRPGLLAARARWASGRACGIAEVLQHRIFVLLVVAFGVFEWLVRTGRLRVAARRALVFPLLCAVGGGLLLTHSHAVAQSEGGVPHRGDARAAGRAGHARGLGALARAAAAAARRAGFPGRIWPLAFTLDRRGPLLYRES